MRVRRQIGQSTEANLMYVILDKLQQIINYFMCCDSSPIPGPPPTTTTTTTCIIEGALNLPLYEEIQYTGYPAVSFTASSELACDALEQVLSGEGDPVFVDNSVQIIWGELYASLYDYQCVPLSTGYYIGDFDGYGIIYVENGQWNYTFTICTTTTVTTLDCENVVIIETSTPDVIIEFPSMD